MFTLTVIIPFFNEQEFLEKSLKRVIETNVAQNILLVDDNSSDNSSIIANKYVKMYEHLEYIKIQVIIVFTLNQMKYSTPLNYLKEVIRFKLIS